MVIVSKQTKEDREMTFKKFEELFLSKYPDGEVIMHGKFAETEHNKKVAVIFGNHSKVYEYYGAYEDILQRVGINAISKERYNAKVATLNHYKEIDGQESGFFGMVNDYREDIENLERELVEIEKHFIIV